MKESQWLTYNLSADLEKSTLLFGFIEGESVTEHKGVSVVCFQGNLKITIIPTRMTCSCLPPPIHNISLPLQEFSLPSITLFERSGLRGKKVVLTDGSVNLQLAGGCSRVQSVLVEGAT